MNRLMFVSWVCCLAIFSSVVWPAEKKPWAKHCTLRGIPLGDKTEDGKNWTALMHKFVTECAPVQACVLACERHDCGAGAGGCFHDCGQSYIAPEILAELYDAKSEKVCPK
jgi:hypothetical protein